LAENNAPIARDIQVTLAEDTVLAGQLPLATDADGDPITYSASGTPSAGVLLINNNGSFSYTPLANFTGADEFQYQVSDGRGGINNYVVRVNVTPVNDAPLLLAPLANASSNVGATATLSLPVGSFFDVDGDPLTLIATRADGTALPAWLRFDAGTRSFTATPALADVGTLALRVSASDGVASVAGSFSWTVTNFAARAVAGKVAVGALQGASIYLDSNGNHQPDAFEDSGLRTDASGRFAGTVYGSGELIAVGGYDASSLVPNSLVLSAPVGATVINPLTTLVQTLVVNQGLSAAAAQAAVKVSLALPASVDLLNFDALAKPNSDADAVRVQRASAQLAVFAATLDDTGLAMSALASKVALGTQIDLASAASLQAVLANFEIDASLPTAAARANARLLTPNTLTDLQLAQSGALPHYRAWDPSLEQGKGLVDALLAAGSGLLVDANSVRVQFGSAIDPKTQQTRASVGYFGSLDDDVALGRGVILSTGDATPAASNTQAGYGLPLSLFPNGPALADADLLAAVKAGFPTATAVQDVSYLAFSFTVADPSLRYVQLDLVFGSDEYPEFVDSPYVDIAAVLVNGVNYALFQGKPNQPLSVTQRSLDSGAFQDNGDGHLAIEYDGLSRKLTITAPVIAGANTLKIAIGDTGDAIYDSAVIVANLRAVANAGSALALRVDGTAANDTLDGTVGDDLISLFAGNDSSDGGAGNDLLDGGSGNDTLSGGAGDDTVLGGEGIDTAVFVGPASSYIIEAAGAGSLRVRGISSPLPADASAVGDLLGGIEFLQFADRSIDVAALVAAPAAPVLLSVTDDVGASTGVLASGARTDDNQPTFAGTAAPGALIKLYDGANEAGSTTANAQGQWSLSSAVLSEGNHSLSLRAANAFGNQSASSPAFALWVDVVNDMPTGSLVITGIAQIGQRLGVNSTVADLDGLGPFSYTWLRGGAAIAGATDSSYTLGEADVGTTISVRVNYTDGGGRAETVSSAATAPVAGQNIVNGSADNDSLSGSGFADVINGLAGNDTLIGLAGNDSIDGGVGNDLLDGGLGSDTLVGATGYDVARYSGSTPVVANLLLGSATQGSDSDVLVAIEALIGSSGADTFTGLDGRSFAVGETFRPGGGNDTVNGGTGVDIVEYSGPRSAYTIVRGGNNSTDFTVTHNSGGADGVDTLRSVERLLFSDSYVAFGPRAEEVARVAFVLWSPLIASSKDLFSKGISFYDNGYLSRPETGYDFDFLTKIALTYWPISDTDLAARLVANVPNTTRTAAQLLTVMANAGGGEAGRIAATQLMANEPLTLTQIELAGFLSRGIDCSLNVDGVNFFPVIPG
jgi:Ca2+-binding RTX toxin-like protein